MRRFFAFVLVLLCLSSSLALAAQEEPRLTFPEAEHQVLVGKTLTARPKLVNTRQKATYAYYSSDETVATVSQRGTVKGIGPGTATITSVATTKAGEYAASYTLQVFNAVEAIHLGDAVTLAAGTAYALQPMVMPVDDTIKGLTFSSNNKKVATVDENGVITAKRRGTATITARAIDGSKRRASVKVTVRSYDILIRSLQGAVVKYPPGRGVWQVDYQSENQLVEAMGNDYHSVLVLPRAPGVDNLTITVTYPTSTRDYKYSVYVAPDALLFTDDDAAMNTERAYMAPAMADMYELAYEIYMEQQPYYFLIDTDERLVRNINAAGAGILVGEYKGDLNRRAQVLSMDGTQVASMHFAARNDPSVLVLQDVAGRQLAWQQVPVEKALRALAQAAAR